MVATRNLARSRKMTLSPVIIVLLLLFLRSGEVVFLVITFSCMSYPN